MVLIRLKKLGITRMDKAMLLAVIPVPLIQVRFAHHLTRELGQRHTGILSPRDHRVRALDGILFGMCHDLWDGEGFASEKPLQPKQGPIQHRIQLRLNDLLVKVIDNLGALDLLVPFNDMQTAPPAIRMVRRTWQMIATNNEFRRGAIFEGLAVLRLHLHRTAADQ